MAAHGLVGHRPRRRRGLTKADSATPPAPDLVGRLFDPDQPDVAWCGDITYIPTDEAGCIWRRSSTWPPATCSAGRWTTATTLAWSLTPWRRPPLPVVVTGWTARSFTPTVSMWRPVLLGFLTRTAMDARGCWCRDAPRLADPHADRHAAWVVVPRIRRWPGSTRPGARLVDGVTLRRAWPQASHHCLVRRLGRAARRPGRRAGRRPTWPASHRPAGLSSAGSTPTRTCTSPPCSTPPGAGGHRGVLHPRAGDRALVGWLRGLGEVRLVGIEGTGSYGAGITRPCWSGH
jgi:hypothetical protein